MGQTVLVEGERHHGKEISTSPSRDMGD
ncbi:hypothetical protein HU200_043159 [Digitaria exilis]|uniref:Uncharacterized protein n=1 Tax=Digitaria exilis TaxID=1010633 RepID=A0A835B494_9POAL|nr:hypothetical protein HU200_043159 [Digitaria exilis]